MDIVEILKAYNKKLPIDFVASLTQRNKAEILEELEALQKRGAIKIEGDNVRLS
jgi:hypothetical protein